ncbi:hypothetical protein DVH29_09255 [Pelagibacterium lacus]|uniref:Uncharacterized protein n=2 Tax=Pelagibacterium lacus TaxID=2282655 RepID=A0A369W4J4_9HYPH|nr:hypothetical protein DVH29_09255 [Pelagibacterium lacus]
MGVGAGPAHAEGLSSLEAINRCEAFAVQALRPDVPEAMANRYKIACYFGLVDAQVDTDTDAACRRASQSFPRAHRDIAEFVCLGAYRNALPPAETAF